MPVEGAAVESAGVGFAVKCADGLELALVDGGGKEEGEQQWYAEREREGWQRGWMQGHRRDEW